MTDYLNRKLIAYRNVFSRGEFVETTFSVFLNDPVMIYNHFGVSEILPLWSSFLDSSTPPDEIREKKRTQLCAVNFSMSGILTIDIDVSDDQELKTQIANKLSKLDCCLAVKQSVRGNLVAFFPYDCSVADYPFLYYKLYLELVLLLGVNVDFLPELGRLRFVSGGPTLHFNADASVLTEVLRVDRLPYINAKLSPKEARAVKFGSQ